jgi:hypothetical protein
MTETKESWQAAVYDLLKGAGVTQFAYVPDAGHKVLIDRSLADDDVHSIPLTTEEEGVAMLASLARRYDFAYPEGTSLPLADPLVTIRPVGGLPLTVTRR